jgi:probable F420-dependent oxidoreductase
MSEKRQFRFGIVTGSAPTRAEWLAPIRKAEELGYATLLLTDHFVNDFPPLVPLMAAADATSTLRVGTFVFDNDFRHPALLAKEVAALDLLSEGRVELGIGAGWHQIEYQQVGLPFDEPGVRIERLEEALQILKQFFTQDRVNFTGKYYTVSDLLAMPKTAQRPRPPIFIGGGGKKLLTLAAREADIIGIHFKAGRDGKSDPFEHTAEAVAQKISWVQQAAGERFPSLELNMMIRTVVITDNRQQAVEEYMRSGRGLQLSAEQHLQDPYLLFGSVEQIAEQLQRTREQFGVSYFVIGDDYMETFAPVAARLAGK